MAVFELSEEEKKRIREQHLKLEKDAQKRKEELKNGEALTKDKKTPK